MSSNNFPKIESLKTIQDVVNNDPQWKIKQKGNFYFCSYRLGTSDNFPDPESAKDEKEKTRFKLLREIRGLVFDAKTLELVSRPFQKFFNVNETPETKMDKIELKGDFWVLEKLDGSMCQPILDPLNDEEKVLRISTKMGFDSVPSQNVEKFLYGVDDPNKYPKIKFLKDKSFKIEETKECNSEILNFCVEWILKGFTPIFEFCSPKCKIILDYEKEMMTLIGLRENVTGYYIPYDEMKELADKSGLRCAKKIEIPSKIEKTSELLNYVENLTGIEGIVLRFKDGRMYKIKTKWYGKVHKSKMSLQWGGLSEGKVWLIILEKSLDDVLPVLNNDQDREHLLEFNKTIWNAIFKKSEYLEKICKDYKSKTKSKKEYADLVNKNLTEADEKSILLNNYEVEDFTENLVKVLKIRANQKIDHARKLIKHPEDKEEIKYKFKNSFY